MADGKWQTPGEMAAGRNEEEDENEDEEGAERQMA